MRKVHFGDEVWTYKVGRSAVSIRDPNRKHHVVHKSEVGRKKLVFDLCQFEYVEKIEVKPSMVKEYIERYIRNKK